MFIALTFVIEHFLLFSEHLGEKTDKVMGPVPSVNDTYSGGQNRLIF